MKKALLIIDVQNDYFDGGKNPLYKSVETATIIKNILSEFREKNLPIIHIQHISTRPEANFFIKNTEGSNIHPFVEPQNSEKVIIKNYPNSFKNTELLKYLEENKIEELIICGMMTHMCVAATTKAAFDYGYKCEVIADGCTTKDLQYDNKIISAETVHNTILASLNGVFAKIINSNELRKNYL